MDFICANWPLVVRFRERAKRVLSLFFFAKTCTRSRREQLRKKSHMRMQRRRNMHLYNGRAEHQMCSIWPGLQITGFGRDLHMCIFGLSPDGCILKLRYDLASRKIWYADIPHSSKLRPNFHHFTVRSPQISERSETNGPICDCRGVARTILGLL